MFGGLHQAMRAAYHRAGMLYEVHLDLLYQCDLDCEHCYLDDKARPKRSTAFWLDVLDQAADLQVASVTLSGGEVFLRKDALTLVAHARARGLFVHLKSHGGHIDAAAARRLAELGVTSVWLSWYSTDAAIHDAITRRRGSQAATVAALHRLVEAGVDVVVACAVMKRNRDSWRGVVEACEVLGVPVSLDGEIRAAHSGDGFPTAMALEHDDRVALERFRLERGGGCAVPGPAPDWETGKSCVAGVLSLYVSPEGRVTPCVTWPEALGDLSAGDRLADLWRGSERLAAIRGFERRDRAICATCPVRQDCDFCMGQAWVGARDPHQPVEVLCRSTRAKTLARAEALGLPEPPLPAGLARARFRVLSDRERALAEREG